MRCRRRRSYAQKRGRKNLMRNRRFAKLWQNQDRHWATDLCAGRKTAPSLQSPTAPSHPHHTLPSPLATNPWSPQPLHLPCRVNCTRWAGHHPTTGPAAPFYQASPDNLLLGNATRTPRGEEHDGGQGAAPPPAPQRPRHQHVHHRPLLLATRPASDTHRPAVRTPYSRRVI